MVGFIFGGDTGKTPEDLARERALAEAMLARGMSGGSQNAWEGMGRLAHALAGRYKAGRVADQEKAGRATGSEAFRKALESLTRTGVAAPPSVGAAAPAAAPAGGGGMSLTDAMIDVESGGDPNAVSPAGAVGLMQIMPDTARDPGFGVTNIFDMARGLGREVPDESDATLQALLRDPEINRAFGETYKTAMGDRYGQGTPEALAAYNAGPGAVDRFGGVPPYEETQNYVTAVAKRMGGGFDPGAIAQAIEAPPAASPGQGDLSPLVEALANPWLEDWQRGMLTQELQRRMAGPETMTPYQMAQLDLAERRLAAQMAGQGGFAAPRTDVTIQGPESDRWGDPPKDHVWIRDQNGEVITEPDPSGLGVRPVSAPVAGTVSEEERIGTMRQDVQTAQTMLRLIDDIAGDDQLRNATGWGSYVPIDIPGVNARVRSRMEQLQGQLFLQAYAGLRGGGQITEVEGRKAEQAMARMKAAQSYDDYIGALNELRGVVDGALRRADDKLPPHLRSLPPEGVTQEEWDAMDEADKAAWR